MSTITINSDIYQKAERYAKLNNINLSHLIEKFLMKLQTPSAKDNAALALPDHLEKLAGCLSFEDALQYNSAKSVKADYIITRNTKDFTYSDIKVLTPREFTSLYL